MLYLYAIVHNKTTMILSLNMLQSTALNGETNYVKTKCTETIRDITHLRMGNKNHHQKSINTLHDGI